MGSKTEGTDQMISVIDLLVSVAFWGMLTFGAKKFFVYVEREAITKVHHGLSPLTPFTNALIKGKKTMNW